MKIFWIIVYYVIFVFGLIVFTLSIWAADTNGLIVGGVLIIWGRVEMIEAEKEIRNEDGDKNA